MLIHLQEELGHNGIGAADAGAGAHGQTGHILLVGTVEHDDPGILPHLDVLNRHGGVLHADDPGILLHLSQQRGSQGHTGQLGNVVDDEVGVGSGRRDVVPVAGDAILGQVEVDGGNGGNGIHTQALSMSSQLHAVGGVVAGNVGNDDHLALGLGHHVLQYHLALSHALVDALTGGAAHIQTVDTLANQVAGQGADLVGRNVAGLIIAGVKGRNHALVFFQIAHFNIPSLKTIINELGG